MPTTFTPSNRYLRELHTGGVNIQTDSIRIILMASGFTFDRDAHAVLTDISGSELSGGNGYTTNGIILANVDVTNIEDDTNDRSDITWDDASWVASVGSIGPTPGAIIYDDTHANNIVIGYHLFSSVRTATAGDTLLAESPLSRIEAG